MTVNADTIQSARKLVAKTVTIANGASLSGAVDLRGLRLAAIVMPADWDAANLSFQASLDDGTYFNVYTTAGEKTVTAADDRYILIPPDDFAGAQWLKVRSGTAGVPVNQTAARTITLLLRA